jgi:hypothetical protein
VADHRSLDLLAAAEVIGGYRWLEHRLFEITGAWSAQAYDPAVRLHLFEASHQHAWHAELWADRLPALAHLDPEALSLPYGPAVGPLIDTLSTTGTDSGGQGVGDPVAGGDGPDEGLDQSLDPASADVARLAALYRVVVPRLVATYGHHRQRAVPLTDGPTIRALTLALRDEVEAWQSGESLLESLLVSPRLAGVAADSQRRLEGKLVGAGVRLGLAPWPKDRGQR